MTSAKLKVIILILGVMIMTLFSSPAHASSQAVTASSPLTIQILSAQTLSGTAGDFVTVEGQLQNTSQSPITDVTTYLSLVDLQNKLPVDLEDWSAEKGQYIGSVDPGQTLPLRWKIHFVKAGDYSIAIVADTGGNNTPLISTLTHFHVSPKRNLNPGQVLPVAFGVPILLLLLFAFLNYRQTTKHG